MATIAFTVYLYVIIPKGFFPQQDTGRLTGAIQADQNTSFQAMSRRVTQFANTVSEDPAVEQRDCIYRRHGNRKHGPDVRLSETVERAQANGRSSRREIAGQTSHIAGATLFLQAVQDVRVGGRQTNAQYQYTLQSDNLEDLLAMDT